MNLRSTGPLALTLALLALVCGACGAPADKDGASAPSDAIQEITLGAGLGVDGAIETGWGKTEFPLGDPIYLAMDVSNARENAEVEVQWIGPGGAVIDHEVKRALPERQFLSFKAPDSVSILGVGKFKVKVLYLGHEVRTLDFEVTSYDGQIEEPAPAAGTQGAGSGQGPEKAPAESEGAPGTGSGQGSGSS